jgi:uncharacterized protein (DUF58 family)
VAGVSWLLLTSVLVSIGLLKGINLLLLFGYLMLVVWALNGVAANLGLRRLRAIQRIEAPVFAGSACTLEVEIAAIGKRPVPGARIEAVAADREPVSWFLPRVGRDPVVLHASTLFGRRGRSAPGQVAVVRGHPFGLVFWRAVVLQTEGVVVLPRLGWVHRGRLRQVLRHASPQDDCVRRHRPQRHPTAQAEFHGLRPWRPGDSRRSIHWRTTARCGELMVREFEEEPSDNLILVFDPTQPGGPKSAALFEETVSLAATICWTWCRQGGERLVLAIASPEVPVLDDVPGPSHSQAVLEALALVQGGAVGAPQVVARSLARFADVPAACALISSGPSSLAGPLTAALRRQVVMLGPHSPDTRDFYEPPRSVPQRRPQRLPPGGG